MYARHWGHIIGERMMPLIDCYILAGHPAGAEVLDLCCGTGDLAALLVAQGCRVTGLDGSGEMLAVARERAPGAAFVHADARALDMPGRFDGVVSTFDSLNHLVGDGELEGVFARVHDALRPGGVFLFDLNTTAAYVDHWDDEFNLVDDDLVCAVRSSYEPGARRGRFEATILELGSDGAWRRSDVALTQRPYDVDETRAALAAAGFADIVALDAETDLRWARHTGRAVYVAARAAGTAGG